MIRFSRQRRMGYLGCCMVVLALANAGLLAAPAVACPPPRELPTRAKSMLTEADSTSIPTPSPPAMLDGTIPQSGRLDVTLEQLGYETRILNRNRRQLFYSVGLPGNFQISPTGNYLDLITYHLPEVPDKPSALKTMVNGHLVSVIPLTEANAISNTVRIPLAEAILWEGWNTIRLDLETSAMCWEPGGIVDLIVDPGSTISFGYEQNPYPADLANYPYPFTETSLLNIPTTIVLSDDPTADELSAATTVAAGLGQESGGTIDLSAISAYGFDAETHGHHHLIVVGTPARNALLEELELPLPIDDGTLEPGQGYLAEVISPWDGFRLILVVSGLDDGGVFTASQALSRDLHFLGMRGSAAIVRELRSRPQEPDDPRPPIITLSSLGYEDTVVYGTEPRNYVFRFALPLGWQLEENALLVLKLAHADILDPFESALDIKLNGVPIGSALLDESNAEDGKLGVSLPPRLLQSGRNHLDIGIEMNFPGTDNVTKCLVLDDERAWTVISSETEIFLPHSIVDLPADLGLFPFPFGQLSGLDQMLFVLPDQPSPAVRLGSPTGTEYLAASVAYASEATQSLWQDYHLIVLGRPLENALLGRFNAYLPHPFLPDSDVLAPLVIDSVALQPDPSRDAGLLQIADSPWNEERTLLVITGTTDEGVRLALQALLEAGDRIGGNLAVVEPVVGGETEEGADISTFSIDTRPPVFLDRGSDLPIGGSRGTTGDDSMPSAREMLLAVKWWR
jgi:hypothetical protein